MKQNTKLLKTAIERRGKSKCLLVRLRPKGRLNVAHWYEEPNGKSSVGENRHLTNCRKPGYPIPSSW